MFETSECAFTAITAFAVGLLLNWASSHLNPRIDSALTRLRLRVAGLTRLADVLSPSTLVRSLRTDSVSDPDQRRLYVELAVALRLRALLAGGAGAILLFAIWWVQIIAPTSTLQFITDWFLRIATAWLLTTAVSRAAVATMLDKAVGLDTGWPGA